LISNYDDPFTSSAHKLEYEFVMPPETSPSPSDCEVGGFFMLSFFYLPNKIKTQIICFLFGPGIGSCWCRWGLCCCYVLPLDRNQLRSHSRCNGGSFWFGQIEFLLFCYGLVFLGLLWQKNLNQIISLDLIQNLFYIYFFAFQYCLILQFYIFLLFG